MRKLLLLITIVLLTGCTASPAAQPAGRPVIVLVDLSGSTEAVASTYRQYVQTVIDSLKGGEHLMVLPISSTSLTATAAVDVHFPAFRRFTTNEFTHGRAMKKARDEALTKVDALLTAPRTEAALGTAIIDGLLQARDLLGGQPGTICIISDMVEDSDLARFETLADNEIPTLMESLGTRRPTYPAGTRVHVAGLSAAGGHIEPAQVLTIRRFWETFFAEAGAQLVEYGPEFHSL
ncbi:MAG: hypothetical protein K0R39_528 [Symbiobacteriaceae bacterium]|jgi:hypothetical protein|nr:hypothetical protein [Symbiobacteriaceae bacterium]